MFGTAPIGYLDPHALRIAKAAFDAICLQLAVNDLGGSWEGARRKRAALRILEMVEAGERNTARLVSRVIHDAA